MKRGLLGSLLVTLLGLAAPAAADAASDASVSGSTLTIIGTNVAPFVTVNLNTGASPDRFEVSDANINAGSGCDQNGTGQVFCDAPGITQIVMTASGDAGSVMSGSILGTVPNTVSVTLNGGSGNDIFNSGTGNDTLHGNAGSNDIDGNSGNDTIDTGGTGNVNPQILTGGDGIDVIAGAGGNNIITGGTDAVDSDDEGDTITGGPLIDDLNGSGAGRHDQRR